MEYELLRSFLLDFGCYFDFSMRSVRLDIVPTDGAGG